MRVFVDSIEWVNKDCKPSSLHIEIFLKNEEEMRWEIASYIEKNYGEAPYSFAFHKEK